MRALVKRSFGLKANYLGILLFPMISTKSSFHLYIILNPRPFLSNLWWIEATGFREQECNKFWFLSNYSNEKAQLANRGIPSESFFRITYRQN